MTAIPAGQRDLGAVEDRAADHVLPRPGAAPAARKGPKNTGTTLAPPRTYETEQERRVRAL
jgi:hypothetical protein